MKLYENINVKILFVLVCHISSLTLPKQYVYKYVLENGLTLLVHQVNTMQNVSSQIFYNVGSKDEADDEKGLAHWLEHMCLKGTKKMSETDFRETCLKLSGTYNASTTYDYTQFYIDLPLQHWYEALPIFADIMNNCTFKQDLLNAELQVVIQEMKNHRDNYYIQTLIRLMSSIFPDHPYHYPVLGYRKDLESLSRDKLVNFYKKHYIPNNATLVVVGNVQPEDVYKKVVKEFSSILSNSSYTRKKFTHQKDICSQSITLYRNTQNQLIFLAYMVPGCLKFTDNSYNALQYILGGGQSSRLYKKLVENLKLAHSVNIDAFDLFDYGILYINFEPTHLENVEIIIKSIQEELEHLEMMGPSENEISQFLTNQQYSLFNLHENNHQLCHSIAKYYLATGNENILFEPFEQDYQQIKNNMQSLIAEYLRPTIQHQARLLKLPEQEQNKWNLIQEQSNKEDLLLKKNKARISKVEGSRYIHTIRAQEPNLIDIPKPQEYILENGLKILYFHNNNVPKIEIYLDLKFNEYYEPQGKETISIIHNLLLLEGTMKYTKDELFANILNKGIQFTCRPGIYTMSLPKKEILSALDYLKQIVTAPLFSDKSLNKHKELAYLRYNNFWCSSNDMMRYLMNKHLYDGFFSEPIGTPESIENITTDDIISYHAQHVTPQEATIAIVGDLSGINIIEALENTLGAWKGPKLETRKYFNGQRKKLDNEVVYHIPSEQVLLGFSGLSVTTNDPDYLALMLFNATINSKLFTLRESSNSFYWIDGSIITNASNFEPGQVIITTQVSQSGVKEAQDLILDAVDTLADQFSEMDLLHAQQIYMNDINNYYATNAEIADSFVLLNRRNQGYDYFYTRAQKMKKITVEEVRKAAKRVLNRDNLTLFKVGPVLPVEAPVNETTA